MKSPRTFAIVVGAIALLLVGFLFFRSPKPLIEIKAETITDIGPFPLVNTYVTSLTVVIVLAIVAFAATRNVAMIPRGLQNVVEAVMDAFYNICVNTAGEKNGRRFFPVVMTIFTFIWIANWMALLPFFNVIGSVEKVNAVDFKNQAVVFSKTAGISFINRNQKALDFNKDQIKNTCAQFDTVQPGQDAAKVAEQKTSCTNGQRGLAIATKLDQKEGTTSGVGSCTGNPGDTAYDDCLVKASDTAISQLESNGKQLGDLVPYFRSMNTDINSPLSIAIIAMIFIEFWGITALGALKYAGKFFVSPLKKPLLIGTFVGFLEFIAELARLISFTFRLFGNMLAGEILLLVMTFLAPFLVALPFYGLETFVGIIQAFVFAMLTLVFGVLAVSAHEGHEDHDEGAHGDPSHGEHAVAAPAH